MTWISYLIVLIISVAVSIAMAPRPPEQKPASLDDFSLPTAEPGRSIPVIFGDVTITGPNIVWYGDLDSWGIEKSTSKW